MAAIETQPDRCPEAVRLNWPGRDDTQVVLVDEHQRVRHLPPAALAGSRLVELEQVGNGEELLIWGDNAFALEALLEQGYAEQVDLVYIDPPFRTGRRFEHYPDSLSLGTYLSLLHHRLQQLQALMSPQGTLVVHLDDHAVHHVRCLLDEIFGPQNFRNSVVVKRVTKNLQRQFDQVAALPLAHDVLLVYSREPARRYPLATVPKPDGARHPEGYWKDFWSTADRPTMRYELFGVTPARGQWKWCRERAAKAVGHYQRYRLEGQGPLVDWWRARGSCEEYLRLQPSGKVAHWVPPSDSRCLDTLWDDFSAYGFTCDFPTEKSCALLERVLQVYSEPGALVLDAFAGSGTTGAAAARLGRRWILVERGPQALTHIVPRLREAAPGGFRVCGAKPGF